MRPVNIIIKTKKNNEIKNKLGTIDKQNQTKSFQKNKQNQANPHQRVALDRKAI